MTEVRRLSVPIGGRDVFERATSVAGLMEGWARVAANGGAAGGDGITVSHFATRSGTRIAALSEALRNGRYRPGLLRYVQIPKRKGGFRQLTIPCISDRIVQSSVSIVLTPLLDAEFEDGSFGYRPGRSVKQAVARVEALRREGFVHTIDADIDNFFDTIPIDRLMVRFAASVSDSPLTDLVALWLEQAARNGRGIAQGSPLSPLLANLYLDELDEKFAGRDLRIVRYADDFLVLTKTRPQAEAALPKLRAALADLGLALDSHDVNIRDYDETLRFLGFSFLRAWSLPQPAGDEAADVIAAMQKLAAEDERRDTEAVADAEMDDPKLDRGLRVLYLRRRGRRLGLRNQSFAVFEESESGDGREILAVHSSRVDRIELGPEVDVDLGAIRLALECDVPLAFTDGHGRTLGHVSSRLSDRASRHLAQGRHALDPALRLALTRLIVSGRIANMRNLLRRLNYRSYSPFVARTAAMIGRVYDRAWYGITSQDAMMPYEAVATKLYWKAWSSRLMHGFSLQGRIRRKGAGPANIALDFTSWLLTRDISAVVLARGLHPGIGIVHATQDHRDACVYDLTEAFRAGLVESVVLAAVNRRQLTLDMFGQLDNGQWRMNRHGQEALIRAYEKQAERAIVDKATGKSCTWRRMMVLQAEAFAAHVEGRGEFRPYVIDH